MRRIALTLMVAALMLALMAAPALATIHPIVESADCVGTDVPEGHPTGDAADPPGATPGDENPAGKPTGQGNNELRALQESDDSAAFGHKLDGECGKVGQ